MPEWGDEERDGGDRPGGQGLLAASLRLSAHMLEREQDRWFLWLPVLFAGGIVTYFPLADEPAARVALALLVGAIFLRWQRGMLRSDYASAGPRLPLPLVSPQ